MTSFDKGKLIVFLVFFLFVVVGLGLSHLLQQPWLWSFWGPSMLPNAYTADLAGDVFQAQVSKFSAPKYPGDLLTYDKPLVTTYNGKDFDQQTFGGYWVRHDNEWVQFTFSGILPTKARRVYVDIYLDVTNRMNGEGGLDGVVNIEIFRTPRIPEKPKECKGEPKIRPSYRIRNVLLENVYTHSTQDSRITGYPRVSNVVGPHPPDMEAYRTHATIDFSPNLIYWYRDSTTGQKRGAVTIRIVRHVDDASVNTPVQLDRYVPILMRRLPAGIIDHVPRDVYENDDPKTVHLGVATEEITPDVDLCMEQPTTEPKFAEKGVIVLKDYGPWEELPTTTTITTTPGETTTTETTTTTIGELLCDDICSQQFGTGGKCRTFHCRGVEVDIGQDNCPTFLHKCCCKPPHPT